MGMIKLPQDSISFFEDNYSEIFKSGNLAEGKWIAEVEKWAVEYTRSPYAHVVNSNGAGIFSILNILNRYFNKRRVFCKATPCMAFGLCQLRPVWRFAAMLIAI